MARRRLPLGGGREMLDSMRNGELRAFLRRADQLGLQAAAAVDYVTSQQAYDEFRRFLRGAGPRPRTQRAHLRAFDPGNALHDADAISGGDVREWLADTLADAHAYFPSRAILVRIQLYSGDTGELAPYSGERVAS